MWGRMLETGREVVAGGWGAVLRISGVPPAPVSALEDVARCPEQAAGLTYIRILVDLDSHRKASCRH